MKKNVFKRYKYTKNIIIFSFVFICGIVSLIFFQSNKNSSDDFTVSESSAANKDNNRENEFNTDTSAAEKLVVYVCGRVRTPGVYELKYGDRVIDAVNMAGGTLEDADLTSINMAEPVEDSSKIEINSMGNTANDNSGENNTGSDKADSSSDNSGKININKADLTSLMSLPGIGEARAGSIIAYRREHGSFKTIEDIMNVSGIKESAFSKIKDLIKV